MLAKRATEKERLRNMAVGVIDDIPKKNGFRLPLRTIDEIEDLSAKLQSDDQLKLRLVNSNSLNTNYTNL